MALPRIIPALADLTQEIAGPVPLELLRTWADGTQDAASAAALLSGFRIRGHVAVTDTSGLSRLSDTKDLLEVLALISQPKSIVHALGVEVGGRALGTWVADNSRMYYPEPVVTEVILAAMAEAQWRIAEAGSPGIGICVHKGEFYEIGGSLYGEDADTVETLGERHARGGEVLVTSTVADALAGSPDFDLELRPDLSGRDGLAVFTLRTERRMPQARARNTVYPHPYPPELFALLSSLAEQTDIERTRQEIYATYLRQRTILLVSVVHEPVARTLTMLLDELVINALVETVVRHAVGTTPHIVNIGGGLAILTFDSPREALELALTIRADLLRNAIITKTGIDEGPVLLFANRDGRQGVAGEPVNIASKISEDAGAAGQIYLTSRVAAMIPDLPPNLPFRTTVSGITLTGVSI